MRTIQATIFEKKNATVSIQTNTSFKRTPDLVTCAFSPNFSSLLPLLKPGMPFSTKNRVIPWAGDFA